MEPQDPAGARAEAGPGSAVQGVQQARAAHGQAQGPVVQSGMPGQQLRGMARPPAGSPQQYVPRPGQAMPAGSMPSQQPFPVQPFLQFMPPGSQPVAGTPASSYPPGSLAQLGLAGARPLAGSLHQIRPGAPVAQAGGRPQLAMQGVAAWPPGLQSPGGLASPPAYTAGLVAQANPGAAQYLVASNAAAAQTAQRRPPPRLSKAQAAALTAKKHCNCKNSRCLKLYCECFASGRYCDMCNCVSCHNNRENEGARQAAIETILDRNPNAFRPKIQERDGGAAAAAPARHNKGCNCKKSGCLKKYCECFQAAIYCSDICKCVDCKNFDVATGPRAATARAHGAAKEPQPLGGGKVLSAATRAAIKDVMEDVEQVAGLQELATLLVTVAVEEADKWGAGQAAGQAGGSEQAGPSGAASDGGGAGSSGEAGPSSADRLHAAQEAAVLKDFHGFLVRLRHRVRKRTAEYDAAQTLQNRRQGGLVVGGGKTRKQQTVPSIGPLHRPDEPQTVTATAAAAAAQAAAEHKPHAS